MNVTSDGLPPLLVKLHRRGKVESRGPVARMNGINTSSSSFVKVDGRSHLSRSWPEISEMAALADSVIVVSIDVELFVFVKDQVFRGL